MFRYFLFFSLLFAGFMGVSQTNINADCIDAIPLCSTPSFTFNSTSGVGTYTDLTSTSAHNVSNPSSNPTGTNSGCLLSGELKPQWLLITIGNNGFLEFSFGAQNSQHPQVGLYDWAMWKYSPTTCADIQNNILAPVRCNWNGSGTGGTGIAGTLNIPSGGNWSNYEPPLPVLACEQYIICLSNYSGVNTLVSFESLGSASLSCDPNCLNVVSNAAVCSGNSATIIAASSGSLTNITYSVNPGGLSFPTSTFVLTPSVTTTYTVYGTGSTPMGPATQTAVTTVTVYPQPTVVPTVTNAACTNTWNAFNLNLSFTPVGANPSYTVNWTPTPNSISSNTQLASHDSVATLPGIYQANVVSEGGCSSSATFTITQPPSAADFGFTPPGPVYSVTCLQPTVTVTANISSYSYTWTNGLIAAQNGSVANFQAGGTGIWTVTASHPVSNCTATKTLQIGLNTTVPSSALSNTYQTIDCNLNSITTVTATANSPTVNFIHQVLSPFGGTLSSTSAQMPYTPGGVGTFTHHLVNTINGCKTTKTFTVFSNSGFPTFSLTSAQNFTLGCNSRSVAEINITNAQASPTDPGGPVSYSLLVPGSSSATPSGTLTTQSSYQVSVPGQYVVITKNNTNFCETRIPISILSNTAPPGIDSLIVPTTILSCYVPSVTIQGISYSPNVSYRWRLPQAQTQSGDELVVSADFSKRTQTLVATYTFVVEDNSSTCTNTVPVVMAQNLFEPVPRVVSNGSLTCSVFEVMLTNNSSPATGNPFPAPLPVIASYWEGPSPQLPLEKSTTYLAKEPGTYTMTALDLNNGCTSVATHSVPVDRAYPLINPDGDAYPDTLDCGNFYAVISPTIYSNNGAPLTYSWTAPPGATVTGATTGTLSTNVTGDYRLKVVNTINGCISSDLLTVVRGTLAPAFVAEPLSGYAPLQVSFTNNSSSSLGSASITSAWSFGNGTDTLVSDTSPVQTLYTQPGRYQVTMYVQKGECLDTLIRYIEVETPSELEVPNVFTPNGDGVNDEYFLGTANIGHIEMKIVDRWGAVVYELTSETGNIVWDGKNQRGQELPEGVYYYVLSAKGKDGVEYEKKGTISLLR